MASSKEPLAQQPSAWERHAQSLLLALMTAAVLWAARALTEGNERQAALTARVEALTTQVARLDQALTQFQQLHPTRAEFESHEQRLRALEQRRTR